MNRFGVGLLAVVVLMGAGCTTESPPLPLGAPATTTGMLPTGVPTEGVRPPVDNLPLPAEPRQAPPAGPTPGRIVAVGTAPEGIVVDAATRTVAVATRSPNELVLLNADTGAVTHRTALPGFVRHLQLAGPAGPVLVPVEAPMPSCAWSCPPAASSLR